MCNLTNEMIKQNQTEPFSEKWILEQLKDDSNREHFNNCLSKFREEHLKDLRDSMNEYYNEMEVEHGTTV